MENQNELGTLLKQYRDAAFPGEGLRRVAEKVAIDYAHLFRIEAGQYIPAEETLMKLLNAYGLDTKEKLHIFNLARLSEEHWKMIDSVQKAGGKKALEGAFFRKPKPPQK